MINLEDDDATNSKTLTLDKKGPSDAQGSSLVEEGHTANNTMTQKSGCGPVDDCWIWQRLQANGNLHPTQFLIKDRGDEWRSKEYPNEGICPPVIIYKVPVMGGEGGDADRCCCVRSRAGNFAPGSVTHTADSVELTLTAQTQGMSNSFAIGAKELCLVNNAEYQSWMAGNLICSL